ncbi:MAG: hypothetical protein K2P70_15065 [Hyphomonadaceae bacterium]|nr:hypothetical protein [Hyphomonadaceae bacterium]
MFDTLSTVDGPRGLAGANPPQEIATRMNAIWVEFAKTGALPWPAYDAQRIVYDPATDKAAPEAPFPAERILG